MKRKKALLKGPQEKQEKQSITKGLQQSNKNPSGIITPLHVFIGEDLKIYVKLACRCLALAGRPKFLTRSLPLAQT
jgi:hypothetical protein